MLRELMAGRHVTINDADVHLRWLEHDPAIPIMMPATGPKNLRLAGSLADRVMLYVGVDETSVRWAIDHVRAGAEEAGRDPDAVKLSLLTGDVGERRPGGGLGQLPLGAGCVREPHRRHDAAQHGPRHARDDDPAGAEPRRLRLLRGPPLVGRATTRRT